MLSFNGLLAIGLLLANTALIDAAVIMPPNPPSAPRPTRIQKHLKSGSDAQDFAASFHEEMNPSFRSVHGLKKDFSGAERWKESLKNPGGLPIPRVVTHAPEVTLVGRSIPTQSVDREATFGRLARRQYDYTNIYDYPPFPQYGYGPQQLTPVDEDEARLAQYEEFKAEMKRIPDEAGIPRSAKSPFRSGPETQKVVESEPTEDPTEKEDPEVAEHEQLEGDEGVEPGPLSPERGSMDDAVDVLDQFCLLRGSVSGGEKEIEKRSYEEPQEEYMTCNGVTAIKHPNVCDHMDPDHPKQCPGTMLSCGRHCYYPVAGQFWNGQVRAYNPPADEDHPRGPEPVDTIPVTTDTVLVNPYIIQVPRLRNPPPPPPQLDTGSAIWKYAAPSITPTPSIWSPAIPVVFGDLKPHESVITLPMDSDEHGTNVRLLKLITVTTSEHSTATILVMPQETTVTTSLPPATTTALVHKETTVTTSLSPATTTAVIQQEVTVTTSEPPITTTALLHQDFTVTTSQPSTTTTTALAVKEVLVSDPIAVEIKLPVPIPAPGPLQRFSSRPPRKSHPVITASKDPNYSELPEPTNLPRYRSESQTPYEDFWAIQRNKPKGPPVKLGTRAATTQPIITPGPTSSPWSAVKAPQHRGDAGVWTRYGPGWEWKRIEAAGVATPVPGKPSCPDSRTMLKNEHNVLFPNSAATLENQISMMCPKFKDDRNSLPCGPVCYDPRNYKCNKRTGEVEHSSEDFESNSNGFYVPDNLAILPSIELDGCRIFRQDREGKSATIYIPAQVIAMDDVQIADDTNWYRKAHNYVPPSHPNPARAWYTGVNSPQKAHGFNSSSKAAAAIPTSSGMADGRQPRLGFQNFDASRVRQQKRTEVNETATVNPSASSDPENIVVQLAAAGILDALDTDENVALKIVDVDPSVSNPIAS